jgi:2'-5' RNA ligase
LWKSLAISKNVAKVTGKRTFIALSLNDEARRSVSEYIQRLRTQFPRLRVGWERDEKLHLTLKFLGDVVDDQLAAVQQTLSVTTAAYVPFELKLEGPGVFPNLRRPSVLWIGVSTGNLQVSAIAEEIETRLQAIGLPKEKRAFSPHLTIARIRQPYMGSDLAHAHLQHMELQAPAFVVDQLVLYESKLNPTGSVYSPISVHPMGKK